MDKKGTVDRFEGDYAIIELPDKHMIHVAKTDLTKNIKEGDKIYQTKGNKWEKDVQATAEARKRIRKLMDNLFE